MFGGVKVWRRVSQAKTSCRSSEQSNNFFVSFESCVDLLIEMMALNLHN